MNYKDKLKKIIDNKYVNELKYGERGLAINVNNKWYIIVDDSEPIPTQRFTVAHELGHILLGHFIIDKINYRTFGKRTEEEQIADMFAARLLAPACVLHEIGALTPERIKEVCNISITAATIRSERMAKLEKRKKFYSDPLEVQVRNQFNNFIYEVKRTH